MVVVVVVVEIVEVLLLLLLLLPLFLLIAGETMGQGRTPLGIEELRARGIEGGYNLSLHMEAQLHFFRIPAFFAVQNFELCKGNSNLQFPFQDSKTNPFHTIHAILVIVIGHLLF